MEANTDNFQYIEEYYDVIKKMQKDDLILESIELVEEMGNLKRIKIKIKFRIKNLRRRINLKR